MDGKLHSPESLWGGAIGRVEWSGGTDGRVKIKYNI